MGRKRRPTGHQQQIQFFTYFFGVIMVAVVVVVLWFINRSPGGRP